MMMHIMWDPVRLIRYWYAYDVTKEIAKSWRKILPTILLLPVTQHMKHSYGLAKYVHPTIRLRDTDKKKKVKYPSIPVDSYYHGSSVNTKHVALPPTILHDALPSGYSYSPPHDKIQYYSSKELENNLQYKHNNMPNVIVSHESLEGDKEDVDQYPFAHYIVDDGSSREEASASDLIFPLHEHHTEDEIRSSSTKNVLANDYGKKHFNFPSVAQQDHLQYLPLAQEGSDMVLTQNENGLQGLQAGQEIHIVLHPIPVNDFNSDSLKPLADRQPLHFVPVPRSNGSFSVSFGPSPIFFKTLTQNTAGFEKIHEELAHDVTATDDSNIVEYNLNATKRNSEPETANTTSGNTKSSVTWIPQKNENETRRTDQREQNLQPEETTRKVVSVHRNFPGTIKFNKDTANSFSINRHNINMDRLREDLKHGTPVLIPFNKNAYSSDTDTLNPIFSQNNDRNMNSQIKNTHQTSEDPLKGSVVNVAETNSNAGEPDVKNSTQKLLLFLKKRQHSVLFPK